MTQKSISSSLYDTNYYQNNNHGYEFFLDNQEIPGNVYDFISQINFNNKTILDIGCGRGELIKHSILNGSKSAFGIDYSSDAIKFTTTVYNSLNSANKKKAQFFHMDAKNLSFKDNSFDLVFMLDIIEHLHPWELKLAIKEAWRVLKPNGIIYIHTSPNKNLMNIVRFFAKIFKITLRSSEYHVNEQTVESFNKYICKYFLGNYVYEKDRHYWSTQMIYRGNLLKILGKIADPFFDNPLTQFLATKSPLKKYLSTNFWFFGSKYVSKNKSHNTQLKFKRHK